MILSALLSLAQAAVVPQAPGVAAALAAGDAHYARRAEGASGGATKPFEVDGAIAEYRKALDLDPSSYEARLRLMRALFFRGGFCRMDAAGQKTLFDEAKALAEDTVHRLDADVGRVKGRVGASGNVAPAAQVYLWAAVSWGQWAVFHKISAAWQSAPARIRDLGQAAVAIDPRTEQASGYLILGRLNLEAPRVPFVTGWVSHAKGLAYLQQGLALAPENTALQYFLAESLLRLDPTKKDEARALLQRCAASPPRPEYFVEDTHYAQEARELLATLR